MTRRKFSAEEKIRARQRQLVRPTLK
jgi:hypothetical protein